MYTMYIAKYKNKLKPTIAKPTGDAGGELLNAAAHISPTPEMHGAKKNESDAYVMNVCFQVNMTWTHEPRSQQP